MPLSINNFKASSPMILGLAAVGALITAGFFAGRAIIQLCNRHFGSALPSDDIGRKIITQTNSDNITNTKNSENVKSNPIALKLLEAYNSGDKFRAWVFVPPKDEIPLDKPFSLGVGSVGFKEFGQWKLHISINPAQMEQAIPILIDVLHGPEAPRLGFKMQTKALLGAQHQIGKELALIFDEKIEQEALEGNLLPIQNCLSNLYKRFISAGIRPESGYVLTPQTMKFIEQAPDGSQTLEKTNLTIGKFDRAIPCPQGINFFNYRDDSYISVMDQHRNDYKENPDIFFASDLINLAKTEPQFAHNPKRLLDPFINLQIQ